MDTNTFAWKLFELVAPLAALGLTWLSIRAAQLAAAKIKTEHVTRVLLMIDGAVLTAAREMQQVLVDKLKATSRDGDLTAEQGAEAKQAALDSAKAQLGPYGLADVAATLGLDPRGVDRLLGARIEAAVHRIKMSSRMSTDPGTAGDAVPFAA
ncbi:MAG: hypothetical protein E6J90_40010 [Deltaproteobacteria bacterium]|nr:MAG: hypothetical protein E6J90_40010 [Deltaproteobacteria bacterium]